MEISESKDVKLLGKERECKMSILCLLALIAFAIIPIGLFILSALLIFTEDISPFNKKISKFCNVIAKPVGEVWAITGISFLIIFILKVLITGGIK